MLRQLYVEISGALKLLHYGRLLSVIENKFLGSGAFNTVPSKILNLFIKRTLPIAYYLLLFLCINYVFL